MNLCVLCALCGCFSGGANVMPGATFPRSLTLGDDTLLSCPQAAALLLDYTSGPLSMAVAIDEDRCCPAKHRAAINRVTAIFEGWVSAGFPFLLTSGPRCSRGGTRMRPFGRERGCAGLQFASRSRYACGHSASA